MDERDAITDRLLRRSLTAADPAAGGDCLDAETLAALSQGSLPAPRRRAAEAHAADCARCLAMLAGMARIEPAPALPWWRRGLPGGWIAIRWLAPVTAAAVVLAMVIVQRSANLPRVCESAPEVHKSAEPLRAEVDRDVAAGLPNESARLVPRPAMPEGRDATADPRHGNAAERRAPGAAPAVPAPPAAGSAQARVRAEDGQVPLSDLAAQTAPAARADAASEPSAAFSREIVAAPFEIASPDPAIRWRVTGSTVARSTDGGRTWLAQTTASVPLVAGSAPSPAVCWVVGRSGTVLVSTDGQTWAAPPFPDPADLVAVSAAGAESAVVTTSGARSYRTADGGRTWTLQEKSAAPF